MTWFWSYCHDFTVVQVVQKEDIVLYFNKIESLNFGKGVFKFFFSRAECA
jgi:hypothetical protein